MPIRANALAIVAKAPLAGTVKTRLLPYLSAEEAAELARSLLLDQLSHLCAIEAADLYVAFTPPHEEALMRRLAPASFQLFSQSEGDLGARMQNIFSAKAIKRSSSSAPTCRLCHSIILLRPMTTLTVPSRA